MKQVTRYIADDGVEFETEKDCLCYEKEVTLYNLIAGKCDTTYIEDFNSSIYDIRNIETFIRNNIVEINRIISLK